MIITIIVSIRVSMDAMAPSPAIEPTGMDRPDPSPKRASIAHSPEMLGV
jgi:hypothetical protein